MYGRKLTARRIVTGEAITVPESGQRLVAVLQKHSPRNASKTNQQ